jgi:hypothetical protein
VFKPFFHLNNVAWSTFHKHKLKWNYAFSSQVLTRGKEKKRRHKCHPNEKRWAIAFLVALNKLFRAGNNTKRGEQERVCSWLYDSIQMAWECYWPWHYSQERPRNGRIIMKMKTCSIPWFYNTISLFASYWHSPKPAAMALHIFYLYRCQFSSEKKINHSSQLNVFYKLEVHIWPKVYSY